MRAVLIANSNAGQRKRDDFANAVEAVAGDLAEERLWTSGPGDAQRFARQIAGSCDLILVAGGDGTINEVVNGVMQAGLPSAADRPAIGLVPMGTCNVLANELGLLALGSTGVREALATGARRAIDIGKAGERYFLLMAGYGFDAAAVRKVMLPVKGVIGAPAYVLSALATLAEYRPRLIELGVDNDVVSTRAFMVLIANVSSYAYQQMKLAPFAAIDDGWLDICVFETGRIAKAGFVRQFARMLARRHLDDPHVRYFRAKRVTIASDLPLPGQLDGDPCGETPVTVDLLPKALDFIVPDIYQDTMR